MAMAAWHDAVLLNLITSKRDQGARAMFVSRAGFPNGPGMGFWRCEP